MDTNDLIKALSADSGLGTLSLKRGWRIAAVLALIVAGTVFLGTIGPRADIAHASETVRFLFKFVVTITLSAGAFYALLSLSRPGGAADAYWLALLAAPALLVAAIVLELVVVPSSLWTQRLIGSNSMTCLTFIPIIGLGPLAIFLAALRYGAPTRPRLAGAVAGVLAGGVAASFYAAHCTDDSPLFVGMWYSMAVAILAAAGALIAPRVARW